MRALRIAGWTALTAVVVVIAYFGLWEAPARTPTHQLALGGAGVPVSDVRVETHGWWTVCVTGARGGVEDERLAVILPSTWTAHVQGVVPRVFLIGGSTEVRDRASGHVLRSEDIAQVEGVELGMTDPEERAVVERWIDLCGDADAYVAMEPLVSLQ
ncbi:hypothetical protein [Demequina iriomotensis]|uniref:hypothetical protein n=1 Tax=Demequina iriomotensis TaxID=1536641 RepID=UPI000A7953FE|nr:hypothetical protein [Demequina iriomotensis]